MQAVSLQPGPRSGMRLVVHAAGASPVRVPVRRERIDAGVAAMDLEEVSCWYTCTFNGNPTRLAFEPSARSWLPSGVDQTDCPLVRLCY